MSGFAVPPRQPPGTHSTASWDFQTFLQLTADQYSVGQGAGGAAVLLNRDTLFAPPPSQEGVSGNKPKLSVKTSDPKLDEPSFAGIGLWSMQFATTVLHILVGSMKQAPDTLSGLSSEESLSTTLAYREEAFTQSVTEEGISSPETWGGKIAQGIGVESEGNVTATLNVNDTSVNAAFFAWMESMSQAVSTQIPPLSSETQALLAEVRSTDVAVVQKALVQIANLPSLSLSSAQEDLFAAKFTTLATAIAASNAGGGTFALTITTPGLMIPVMMETLDVNTDPSMTADDKNQLTLALVNICTVLAKANFEESIATKTPSDEYKTLVSKDPQQISSLLFTIASRMVLPSGVTDEDMVGSITAIASRLSALNTRDQQTLESIDRAGLATLFTSGLKSAEESGAITSAVAAALRATLVPLFVDQTVAINRAKLVGDLHSQDKVAIEKSLTFLTEVKTDPRLNPPTRRVAMSYIQALISALGYMANLRGLMLEMETTFTQELGQAKIAAIAEELKIAQTVYTNEMNKIMTTYQQQIAALEKQAEMAWLMPLIGVAVTVLLLILTIAAVVTTVATFGAAAPAWAAAFTGIGAVLSIATASVTTALTVADAACQWTTGKSMWTMMCTAMGIHNPLAQAAFNAAFQILIQVVTVVVTCGAAALLIPAKAAVAAGETFAEEAARLGAIEIGEEAAPEGVEVGVPKAAEEALEVGTPKVATTGEEAAEKVPEGVATAGTGKGAGGAPAAAKAAAKAAEAAAAPAAAEPAAPAAAAAAKAAAPAAAAKAAEEVAPTAPTAATAAAAAAAGAAKAAAVEGVEGAAVEGVEVGAEEGVGAVGAAAAKAAGAGAEESLLKICTKAIAMQAISALFGSGLVGQLLEKAGEALFPDDPKKSAIFSAVMTAVMMIATMAVCSIAGKVSVKSLKAFGLSISDAVDEAIAELNNLPEALGKGFTEIGNMSLKEILQAIKTFVAQIGKWTAKQAMDFLRSLKKWLTSPFTRTETSEQAAISGKTAEEQEAAALKQEFEEWAEGGAKSEALKGLEGEGATTMLSLRVAVKNAFLACLKGIENALLNLRDKFYLAGEDVTKVQQLQNLIHTGTDLLKEGVFAAQIASAVEQYKADELQKYYYSILAQLAEECATVEAMMSFFTKIAGIDQTATIHKISDASGEAFKNWTQLVDLVSSFIKDASARMRELGNKGSM